jgi:hypothetical protein
VLERAILDAAWDELAAVAAAAPRRLSLTPAVNWPHTCGAKLLPKASGT